MVRLQKYIETANIASEDLRFPWSDSDTSIFEGDTETRLVDRLAKITQRANVAYSAILAEWVLGRFQKIEDIELPYKYVEASWATLIDLRYCKVVWEDYRHQEKWRGPVRGPIWLAMTRLQQSISSLVEGNDPEYTTSKLVGIARKVLSAPAVFDEWSSLALKRMEIHCVKTETDSVGEPLSPSFFDPHIELLRGDFEHLAESFLWGLNWKRNPFLSSPDDMLNQGFIGQPYRFSRDSDQLAEYIGGK